MVKPTIAWLPDNNRERDAYRGQVLPWRKWYNLKRWKDLRWQVLTRDMFKCQMCGRSNHDTSKLVADHTVPHRGDERLFWDEKNIRCVCKPCHDGEKQRQEKRRPTGGEGESL